MTQVESYKEKWTTKIAEVKLGTDPEVRVGRQKALPFLNYEGPIPNKPAIALEIYDKLPSGLPEAGLPAHFLSIDKFIQNPETYQADLISLKLASIHPDESNTPKEEIIELFKKLEKTTRLPFIIWGCGHLERDKEVLLALAKETVGKNYLFGTVTQNNLEFMAKLALEYNHNLIIETPLDLNIAKQIALSLKNSGVSLNKMIIYPTTGALGYGLEYAYSITERIRLAGLQGEENLALPMIAAVGEISWRTKQSAERETTGILWESLSAVSYIQAGSDIVTMSHPEAIRLNLETRFNLEDEVL